MGEVTAANYQQAAQQAEGFKNQADAILSDPKASEADLIRAQELMNKYNRIMTAISEILKKEGQAEATVAKNAGAA
jgi:hypothetical protein